MSFNKYLIFIFSIISLIVILILLEFNTDYKLINEMEEMNVMGKMKEIYKISNANQGTLYIATHDYEHKDILITFKYFKNYKNDNFYMLFANKPWNYLLEPIRPSNIEFMYVKEKTVDKISAKLLLGHSVIMFLYKESDSTGPYYIIQNTKCPVTLLKIKKETDKDTDNKTEKETISNHYNSSFQDIYMNNFMAKFTLEIKPFNYDKNELKGPSGPSGPFINKLKHEMYS